MKKDFKSVGEKAAAVFDMATWQLGVADALLCLGLAMIVVSAWYRSKIQ